MAYDPFDKNYTTGSAANATDFFNLLMTFLTYTPWYPFVPGLWGMDWVHYPDSTHPENDYLLKGGASIYGSEFYVGFRLHLDPDTNRYAIRIVGATGRVYDQFNYDGHINCTPSSVQIWLPDAPFNYKIIVNARRFIVIIDDGVKTQIMYAGLIMQYAMPSEYPRPLFIGATSTPSSGVMGFDDEGEYHSAFHRAKEDVDVEPPAFILTPDNVWKRVSDGSFDAGLSNAECSIGPDYYGSADFDESPSDDFGYQDIKNNIIETFGGTPILTPLTVVQSEPIMQTLGVLQGVYYCPGPAVNDVVQVGGIDHYIIPNVFRDAPGERLAIAQE